MKKKLFIAAIAALALVACTEQQSELNLSDVTTANQDSSINATVKGIVNEMNYQEVDGNFVATSLPKQGVTVVAKVNNADYSDGAEGTKLFIATTDANGKFSLSIPAGEKGVEIQSLEVRSYDAIVKVPMSMQNGNLLNDAILELNAPFVVISSPITNVKVVGGQIETFVLEVAPDLASTAMPTDRNVKVNISGKVSVQTEKAKLDAGNNIDGSEKGTAPANTTLIANINAGSDGALLYNIDVKNGEYSFEAALFDMWDIDDVEINILVKPYATDNSNTFLHYFQNVTTAVWGVQQLQGAWEQTSTSAKTAYTISGADLLLGKVIPEIVLEYTVSPAQKPTILGIGNPDVDKDALDVLLYTSPNPFDLKYN